MEAMQYRCCVQMSLLRNRDAHIVFANVYILKNKFGYSLLPFKHYKHVETHKFSTYACV
jgi:hypothetical protein